MSSIEQVALAAEDVHHRLVDFPHETVSFERDEHMVSVRALDQSEVDAVYNLLHIASDGQQLIATGSDQPLTLPEISGMELTLNKPGEDSWQMRLVILAPATYVPDLLDPQRISCKLDNGNFINSHVSIDMIGIPQGDKGTIMGVDFLYNRMRGELMFVRQRVDEHTDFDASSRLIGINESGTPDFSLALVGCEPETSKGAFACANVYLN